MKTKNTTNKKRMISVLIMLCMVFSILPMTAYAASGFSVQPKGSTGANGDVTVTFATNDTAQVMLFGGNEVGDTSVGGFLGTVTSPFTIEYRTKNIGKTIQYQLQFYATDGASGKIYSDVFTIKWNPVTFTTQPRGGTSEAGKPFPISFAVSSDKFNCYLEEYFGGSTGWSTSKGFYNSTSYTYDIPFINPGDIRRFRIVIENGGGTGIPVYSNEFQVNGGVYSFTTQPVGGTSEAGKPFPISFAVSTDKPCYIERYNADSSSWSVYNSFSGSTSYTFDIPFQTPGETTKYRIVIRNGGGTGVDIFSNEFEVTSGADMFTTQPPSNVTYISENLPQITFAVKDYAQSRASFNLQKKNGDEWDYVVFGISSPYTIRNGDGTYRLECRYNSYFYYSDEFTVSPIYQVTINSEDANVTRDSATGSESQTNDAGAIKDVVYTANTGYYFPDGYGFTQNGIIVSRDSYTQITVKGTPTASTSITLPSATKAEPITITKQPQTVNLPICSDKAVFSVEVNDCPCDSYNWQFYESTYRQWFDLDMIIDIGTLSATGQHTKTVTIDAAETNANIFPITLRCLVTRAGETVASDTVRLKVEHKFDKYAQNNATTHKVTCSACGLEKTEAHQKKWICDEEATGSASGIKHFECPLCGYVSPTEAYTISTTANSGIVEFYKNDGTTDTSVFYVFTEKENTYKVIPTWNLKKTGYIFKGWALTSEAAQPVWVPGEKILIPAGNTKLYGVWEIESADFASVSGSFTSFGDATKETTIQLIPQGTSKAPAPVKVTGNSGTYTISNVAPGTYTMKVTKLNHVDREYTVTVGSSDIVQDVEIWLKGDLNGDGKVIATDLTVLKRHVSGTKLITDPYIKKCADLNNDSMILANDLTLLKRHITGSKSLWS